MAQVFCVCKFRSCDSSTAILAPPALTNPPAKKWPNEPSEATANNLLQIQFWISNTLPPESIMTPPPESCRVKEKEGGCPEIAARKNMEVSLFIPFRWCPEGARNFSNQRAGTTDRCRDGRAGEKCGFKSPRFPRPSSCVKWWRWWWPPLAAWRTSSMTVPASQSLLHHPCEF